MRGRYITAMFIIVAVFIVNERPSAAGDEWVSILAKARESVVRLTYPDAPEGICTGFVFGRQRQYIVTARHCIIEDGKTWATRVGTIPLSVVQEFGQEELMVLSPGRGLMFRVPALELGAAPKVGQEVAALGFYGRIASEATATFGLVSAVRQSFNTKYLLPGLIVNGPVMKGMSGGPLIDRHGRVVSVVVCTGFGDAAGLSCGTGFDVMKQLPQD
jgi:S1-C subfamily serine protease